LTEAQAVRLTVGALLGEAAALRLVVLAGEAGLTRRIGVHQVAKSGLVLGGYSAQSQTEQVHVLGQTELRYITSFAGDEARQRVDAFLALQPACLVITRGLDAPAVLITCANQAGIPVLRTPMGSSAAIEAIQNFIELQLAASASVHGVLLDVLGVGILLIGRSGIGKSEAALELIMRGHRLVADDRVEVRQRGQTLVGAASELIKHHIKVRGIGIINIKDMFGVAAVRDEKKIELVLELCPWEEVKNSDRLGVDQSSYPILDVPVPLLRLPVSAGRNVSSLVEVAARNRLLQVRGHHSAREFQNRLAQALADAGKARFQDDVE
jgi:HPr kinase/phosphorylase